MEKFIVRVEKTTIELAFDALNIQDLKNVYNKWVEDLNPLNSSVEGRENYKKRFRGAKLFIKEGKEYKEI